MFKVATGYFGISPFLYYELTYRELDLMMEGYVERRKSDTENFEVAIRYGVSNALNGTSHSIYGDEEKKTNEIDPMVKKQELDYLKNLFS
ncbi:MAG: hypothetical protein LPK26_17345 [Bacillaceae bacterium]|nr:hypothetical protein [Bacillaceae bacterium]